MATFVQKEIAYSVPSADCTLPYALLDSSSQQRRVAMAPAQETVCDVHTFDCTWEGRSLDKDKRHFYHKVW